MYPGYEHHFEMTIRSFLGDEADHIAGQVHHAATRKNWYQKVLAEISRQILEMDTSTKHKQALSLWCESALQAAKEKHFSEEKLLLYILRLTGALLGYVGIRGSVLYTPTYHQRQEQHFTEAIMAGEDPMVSYYEKKTALAKRKEVIMSLKQEGLTDFQIAQVMNISEYQVKKLRKGL